MAQYIMVSCYIREVVSGRYYLGLISLGRARLDFEFRLPGPFSLLAGRTRDNIEQTQVAFQLTIKNGARKITLSGEEFRFFFPLIMTWAVETHGILLHQGIAQMIRAIGIDTPERISEDIDERGTYCCLSQEEFAMLNDPKFGCKLDASE